MSKTRPTGQDKTIIRASFTVDWMTMTCNRQVAREAMGNLTNAYLQAQIALHNRIQLWDSYGYTGWDTKGMRWGRREQDDIIQLRSEVAQTYWQNYLPLASHVSRIDLCATVQFKEHQIGLIREQYATIQKIAEDLPIIRKYSIIQPLIGGDTLYVGSRSSAFFGRIYDKGLESNQPHFANCIRYEVEIKKPLAQQVAESLSLAKDKGEWVSSFVKHWFQERLIECPWSSAIPYNAIEFPRVRTTDETALAWLKGQVAPTVARLISREREADVFEALGLPYVQESEE